MEKCPYDLTGSQRIAGELVGCSHHTVAAHVAARDAGRPVGVPAHRPRATDLFLDKIGEWVEASKGRVARTFVHEKRAVLMAASGQISWPLTANYADSTDA